MDLLPKIKIREYIYILLAIILSIFLISYFIIFTYCSKNISDNIQKNIYKNELQDYRKDLDLLMKNLDNQYQLIYSTTKFIHNEMLKSIKYNDDEIDLNNNINLYERKFYNFEYVIYRRINKNSEMEMLQHSFEDFKFSTNINTVTNIKLPADKTIIQNIFQNQFFSRLINLNEITYLATYSGIFKKNILVGAIATFIPISNFIDFEIINKNYSIQTQVIDNYSQQIVFTTNPINNIVLGAQTDVRYFNKLNIKIVSSIYQQQFRHTNYDSFNIWDLLNSNILLIIFIFFVTIAVIAIFITYKLEQKLNNLFSINYFVLMKDTETLNKVVEKYDNKKLKIDVLSFSQLKNYIELIKNFISSIKQQEQLTKKYEILITNLAIIKKQLVSTSKKLEEKDIHNNYNKYLSLFSNNIEKHITSIENFAKDYNKILTLSKDTYLNSSIILEKINDSKTKQINKNLNILYNYLNINKVYIDKLSLEGNIFKDDLRTHIKDIILDFNKMNNIATQLTYDLKEVILNLQTITNKKLEND
ncbi:MAG: hypothetical protein GX372_03360 [Ignavibacteria bacterium]|jgi:hypothetical protein|nr:hypothetical protein [Ignavibacteria bacterium]